MCIHITRYKDTKLSLVQTYNIKLVYIINCHSSPFLFLFNILLLHQNKVHRLLFHWTWRGDQSLQSMVILIKVPYPYLFLRTSSLASSSSIFVIINVLLFVLLAIRPSSIVTSLYFFHRSFSVCPCSLLTFHFREGAFRVGAVVRCKRRRVSRILVACLFKISPIFLW